MDEQPHTFCGFVQCSRISGRTDCFARAEFLSRFCKEDKICPVITLVLHYGEEPWDGNIDLYGMFDGEDLFRENSRLQEYVPNYKINLVEPGKMESFEKFRTDLQEIFGMLKYRGSKNELMEYMKSKEDYFQNVDEETYYVIREFLHSERMLKTISRKSRGENIDIILELKSLMIMPR